MALENTCRAEIDRLRLSVQQWTNTAVLYASNADYWQQRALGAEELLEDQHKFLKLVTSQLLRLKAAIHATS